jgi:prepilin-type N-terminal cleavage/methylation domain-containing protein
MKLKLSSLNCDKGFTLVEMLVASALGLVLSAMLIASTQASRGLFRHDAKRIRLNEDLRGTLELIGSQIRLAGEGLGGRFPALLVENGGTSSDELIIRRKIFNEVLKVCEPVSSGSNAPLVFADSSLGIAGCGFGDNILKYTAWSTKRAGGTLQAYVYDGTSGGQFFPYTSETNNGSRLAVSTGANWTRDYPVNSGVYLIEQWRFFVEEGVVKLEINEDSDTVMNVADSIENFQVVGIEDTGAELLDIAVGVDWSKLKAVKVILTAADTSGKSEIDRTMSSQFFPRNVLSN